MRRLAAYWAVLTLAPGAATDAVGFSFNGATGPENNFLIDGVNTTDPAFGLLGTQLTLEFIGETEIITGGYNAEYGRATGGVVNVITKSGSNNFHGDIWFYATPFQLDPLIIGRSGEAVWVRRRFGGHTNLRCDAGFVGNAFPAALQAIALIPTAPPGAAARLVSARAPECEHVAIFSRDDRAGGIVPRLPFLRRQALFAFAHDSSSPSRGA